MQIFHSDSIHFYKNRMHLFQNHTYPDIHSLLNAEASLLLPDNQYLSTYNHRQQNHEPLYSEAAYLQSLPLYNMACSRRIQDPPQSCSRFEYIRLTDFLFRSHSDPNAPRGQHRTKAQRVLSIGLHNCSRLHLFYP